MPGVRNKRALTCSGRRSGRRSKRRRSKHPIKSFSKSFLRQCRSQGIEVRSKGVFP